MKKLIILTVFITLTLPLTAKPYFKGQKEYLKKCRSCHEGSQILIPKYTADRWAELLDNNGSMLADLHVNNKETQEYFKSSRYLKKVNYMEAYILHYLQSNKDASK